MIEIEEVDTNSPLAIMFLEKDRVRSLLWICCFFVETVVNQFLHFILQDLVPFWLRALFSVDAGKT